MEHHNRSPESPRPNRRQFLLHRDEKVEFRMIVNQHVFETTFYVSPNDLFDGTETALRIPPQ